MLCPACYEPNLPGVEACAHCGWDMSATDRIIGYDRVECSLLEESVASLHPKAPVTVVTTDPLAVVLDRMQTHHVGAVLVLNPQGQLVGILTERDFLTKIVGEAHYEDHLAQDYMSRDPETVSPDDPIAFALGKMSVGNYRHLPVVAAGHPVGMLSVRDLLKHIVEIC
ncbi:MAG: CBS domain-containing protein [Fimbriiglobus sp.]